MIYHQELLAPLHTNKTYSYVKVPYSVSIFENEFSHVRQPLLEEFSHVSNKLRNHCLKKSCKKPTASLVSSRVIYKATDRLLIGHVTRKIVASCVLRLLIIFSLRKTNFFFSDKKKQKKNESFKRA